MKQIDGIIYFVKGDLDQFVINIEFLLISVIQGVALSAVASGASAMITNGEYIQLLYALSALLIILIFWSQAIMHTLGFIRWPLDMFHNFLYFLVSLIEIMAFAVMDDPFRWFVFSSVFVAVSAVLYYYDLKMIHRSKSLLFQTKEGALLYEDLRAEQTRDLKLFVPIGIVANAISALMIYTGSIDHIVFIVLQIAFSLFILHETLLSFRRRSLLIKKL